MNDLSTSVHRLLERFVGTRSTNKRDWESKEYTFNLQSCVCSVRRDVDLVLLPSTNRLVDVCPSRISSHRCSNKVYSYLGVVFDLLLSLVLRVGAGEKRLSWGALRGLPGVSSCLSVILSSESRNYRHFPVEDWLKGYSPAIPLTFFLISEVPRFCFMGGPWRNFPVWEALRVPKTNKLYNHCKVEGSLEQVNSPKNFGKTSIRTPLLSFVR